MIDFITGTWQSWPDWLQGTLVALGQILAVMIVVILCVAYLTLAPRVFDPDMVTVKLKVFVPLFPSLSGTSLIVTEAGS